MPTGKIQATIGETKHGQPVALLEEVDERGTRRVIAKVYASADGRKIRVVLPELRNYRQTLVNPDDHLLEFER